MHIHSYLKIKKQNNKKDYKRDEKSKSNQRYLKSSWIQFSNIISVSITSSWSFAFKFIKCFTIFSAWQCVKVLFILTFYLIRLRGKFPLNNWLLYGPIDSPLFNLFLQRPKIVQNNFSLLAINFSFILCLLLSFFLFFLILNHMILFIGVTPVSLTIALRNLFFDQSAITAFKLRCFVIQIVVVIRHLVSLPFQIHHLIHQSFTNSHHTPTINLVKCLWNLFFLFCIN